MKRPVMVLTLALAFLVIDGYIGVRLFHSIHEYDARFKPVSVEIVEGSASNMAGKLDVDGDGEDEAVISHTTGSPHLKPISVFNPITRDFLREYYGDTRAPRDYEFFDCYYNQSLKTYVFRFLEVTPRGLDVVEIDNRGNTLHQNRLEFDSLERPFKKAGKWSPRPQLIDLDADNKNELVVVLKSDDPENPRGVACFDPDSGIKYWEYYSGTRIENARFEQVEVPAPDKLHYFAQIRICRDDRFRIVIGALRFNLVGVETEQEEILGPDGFEDLDVGAVTRADGERAVHHQFHVAGT